MKRVIQFKGRELHTNIWRYGHYTQGSPEYHYITQPNGNVWRIDPDTLGQYIGHIDKKGVDIYEGDVCDGHSDGYGVIKWAEFDGGYNYEFADTNVVGVWEVMKDLIIVGNIHDDPNLLK